MTLHKRYDLLVWLFVVVAAIPGCVKIKSNAINQPAFLGAAKNPVSIYASPADTTFLCPLSIKMGDTGTGDMRQFLLIDNFKGHDRYKTVELQVTQKDGQNGVIVLLYHADSSHTDVYHSPELQVDPKEYAAILNNTMVTPADIEYLFVVEKSGLVASLNLTDRFGSSIEFSIRENSPGRPFLNFLAPIGGESDDPESLLIVYMKKFRFIPQKNSEVELKIDGQNMKVTKFPLRMNGEKVYNLKYTLEPIIGNWNPEFDGILQPLNAENLNTYRGPNFQLELLDNSGHPEIAKFTGRHNGHQIGVTFVPAIPDLAALAEPVELKGLFAMNVDEITGIIGGKYQIIREGTRIKFGLTPTEGWSPIPGKAWMKKLQWVAEIDLSTSEAVHMRSKWVKK